ncbi:outer membrane receptor protein involved in Fe transport [Flavobacterium sp. 90]|uniref:TonB-dependent receptor n=1 Tax=unclassified Flavobacterium TaxID=196869 RepID=UPI000EB5200D|nr:MULTISPECIES: TonB-dependent receptor [unclassified Flavobacterium]RKR11546.1 outer membrane receptor protein involved in Fe transport [Flavobacterium sp. 81]TCK55327.1 outer membrane receptor protein involved in Fe transport [Flavobacterium sp. 90]
MRFLLFVFLFVHFSGWSQKGNISGKVTFGNTESALGASVTVTETQKFVIVDNDGQFEIKGLSYGNYTLVISSLEAKAKTINFVLNNPFQKLNILLEKNDPKALKEVVIQKTSVKKEITNKGFSVNVIETKDAANRNLQTNELLDRSAGVRIRQNGGMGSSVNYNLNGMSGNSIRIFIDGIPLSTYGSSFNLNSIPPALIERIEVYKGVTPAYLADDALGGAINVVLKKGAKNTLNASISYGSFNTIQSNFNTTYRDKSGFTLKGSGFYNYSDNDYEIWGRFVYNTLPNGRYDYVRVKRFENRYRSYGGRFEAGFTDVKWADTFLIGLNMSEDHNQIQHGQYMTKPYKGRFSEADATAISLNYSKKDFLFKGLDFSTNTVFSKRHEVVNDTVKWNYNWFGEKAIDLYNKHILSSSGAQQAGPTINTITQNILSSRSIFTYNINEKNRIVFSNLFYTVDRNDDDLIKPEFQNNFEATRDLQKTVTSLAYEMQAFDSRLRTNIFGKFYEQKVNENKPEIVNQNGQNVIVEKKTLSTMPYFGYGLATSYFITPKIMISASAEKAIRLPNENEIFGNPGENISGNSNLKPEQSDNFNAGFQFGPYKINQHKISIAASGFLRNAKDKIVRTSGNRVNDAIQILPFENLTLTQSIGFEASFDYVFKDRLFISMNTSKFNSLFKMQYDNNGGQLLNYDKQLPNEPFFTLNANVQYNFKELIQKNSQLNLYYNCGYVDPFATLWIDVINSETPAQFSQDLGLSYAFPNKQFVVSFDAKNIFDKQIFDNYAVQKPGRAFYLKLNYTINNF